MSTPRHQPLGVASTSCSLRDAASSCRARRSRPCSGTRRRSAPIASSCGRRSSASGASGPGRGPRPRCARSATACLPSASRPATPPRSSPHGRRMGSRRSRGAVRRRGVERHLSDRRRRPGRVPVLGLAHQGDLRRGRRAARQGARGARAPAGAGEDRRLRHRGPARLPRPAAALLDALRELGRARRDAPGELDERAAACPPEDLAILVYTSGTTGKPKGAMHRTRGIVYTIRGYNAIVGQDENDERMCFLPLCHIAERLGGEYFAVYTGSVLNFVENPRRAGERARDRADGVHRGAADLGEVLFERGDRGARVGPAAAGRLRLGPRASATASPTRCSPASRSAGGCPAVPARPQARPRQREQVIGVHRARFCVTGAAPISPELVRWYLASACRWSRSGDDRELRRLHLHPAARSSRG